MVIGSGGHDPDEDSTEDALIAMCDIEKMLGGFAPFIHEMLIVWGIDGRRKEAIAHGRKINYVFRKKKIRQQYNILNDAIRKFESLLSNGEYLQDSSEDVVRHAAEDIF